MNDVVYVVTYQHSFADTEIMSVHKTEDGANAAAVAYDLKFNSEYVKYTVEQFKLED